MSYTPQIYADYDDVLCETALEFTRVLEREFGKRVPFPDIFSFDLGKSFGLSPGEVAKLMRRVHEPDVLAAMEPVESAVEVLKSWRDSGCEVSVITGRPAYSRDASQEWLDRHEVPYSRLQFVDKYSRANPHEDGIRVLSLDELCARKFCLAIEDAPAMVKTLADRTRMPVAMLARPWNAAPLALRHGAARRVARCRNWQEILARFPTPARQPGQWEMAPGVTIAP